MATDDSRQGDNTNHSVEDMVELLEAEIERLKTSLETFQLTNHPDKRRIIAEHVAALDARQDALETLRELLDAARQSPTLH